MVEETNDKDKVSNSPEEGDIKRSDESPEAGGKSPLPMLRHSRPGEAEKPVSESDDAEPEKETGEEATSSASVDNDDGDKATSEEAEEAASSEVEQPEASEDGAENDKAASSKPDEEPEIVGVCPRGDQCCRVQDRVVRGLCR
ncbi:hypothetical protein [uncultured Cohaesibacter sp.]|uniref:hypothetical protein n=1 Tax=uncultured Cohaesibacter sp. TaxID=1002546 RepID=UPI0029C732BD|nr:hypothetical protein [uncultured Cohaesibacter sp.]